MIPNVRFKAVLDTNVIYPIVVRDLLFWLAHYDLYTPKWSKHIFDEWKSVMERKGITKNEANKRVTKANAAFPNALVKNYEKLIKNLELPDPNDCHVLAIAIKTNAEIIVTNNIKDFPAQYLETFGLKAKTADNFIADMININHDQAVAAFKEMVNYKSKPNLDEFEVLDLLRNSGLNKTSEYLQPLL